MRIVRVAEEGIERVAAASADVLRAGGIVLYPTDTLYGLAVDARNQEAVERLIALKGRSAEKAISVVVRDLEQMREYVETPAKAVTFIQAHLPGALTLVLPAKSPSLSHLAPDGTIGVRIPNDAFVQALSLAIGGPYTATSANLSGMSSPSTVELILAQFGEAAKEVDLAVDDGPREGRAPSTVVRIFADEAEILREGAISRERLGL